MYIHVYIYIHIYTYIYMYLLFNLCPWLLLEVQSESIAKFPCYIYALGGNLIISHDGNRVFSSEVIFNRLKIALA